MSRILEAKRPKLKLSTAQDGAMDIRVYQIAMLDFVLNISICLGLHFVLTQIKMT